LYSLDFKPVQTSFLSVAETHDEKKKKMDKPECFPSGIKRHKMVVARHHALSKCRASSLINCNTNEAFANRQLFFMI